MTGPKMSLRISEQLDTFYAVLTHSSNPQSPSSSEFSTGITDGETMVAVTDVTDYIWTPPALDPKYWEHVAKARKVHQTVAELKQGLTQKQKLGEDETQKLHQEVRARERKLLRIIDQYVLDYDDVVRVKKDERHRASGNSSVELGTITPPVSPDMMPDRPLPPLPRGAEEEKQRVAAAEADQQKRLAEAEKKLAVQAKKQRMGAEQSAEPAQRTQPQTKQLPPPPPKAGNLGELRRNNTTAAALDSQGFINSYKKHERYANSDARRDVNGEPQEKPKGRQLLWAGLFGSRNVRPLTTITTRRRSGSAEEARPIPTANRTRLGSPSSSSSLAQHVRGKNVVQSVYV
ncbi:hypothetical protein H4S08_004145 [Coemansia sp. RSA 1365]|nr:hypothetical protein H4S08_004145 [Coemansia sp. RSA 1365]